MTLVKRAHVISRGYLAGWEANGQVLVDDKQNPDRSGVRSLSNATVVKYAYRTELTTMDLETEYARVESAGIPAIRGLATGQTPNKEGRSALISFLDMHRERSGFAGPMTEPAPLARVDIHSGNVELVNPRVGDRIALSRIVGVNQAMIRELPVEDWRWHVAPVESGLITGDGAVLLWTSKHEVDTVTFPLSSTRLLIIGSGLDGASIPINQLIAERSRRWIVDRPR